MATDRKVLRRQRIRRRIRKKVFGTSDKPRLSIFKSNRAITAQLIDDSKGSTLAFVSSRGLSDKNNSNQETSKEVGKKIAETALSNGISKAVFDRGGYLFHGNVKALAEGAREAGLQL